MSAGRNFSHWILALAFLAFGTNRDADAAPVWASRFDGVTGSIPQLAGESPRVTFGPAGELFAFGFQDPIGRQPGLVRLDATSAALLWSAKDPQNFDIASESNALIAFPGGSSVLLSRHLSRFDASGLLIWSVPSAPLAGVVPLDSGDLLFVKRVGNRTRIDRLSAATGKTVETIEGPRFPTCSSIQMANAPSDTIYVACRDGGVARIASNPLRVVWIIESGGRAIAADAGGVYEATGSQLHKRNAADGAPIWAIDYAAPEDPTLLLDADGQLISSGATVERRNSVTGSVLWTSSASGTPRLDGNHQGVYFFENIGSPGGPLRGRIGRLDLATGATLWTHETPIAETSSFSDVAASGSHVVAAGVACEAAVDAPCRHTVWMTTAAGAPLASSPLVSATSTTGGATLDGPAGIFAVATEWGPQGPQLHMRTLAADDGFVEQDTVTPFTEANIPYARWGWTRGHLASSSRALDGHVFVTYSSNALPADGSIVNATLFKVNRADGAIAWQKFFLDSNRIAAVTNPIVDSSGNVVIGIVERDWPFTGLPDRRWVRKYSGANGTLIWERAFPVDFGVLFDNIPPGITSVGADVGVRDAPVGSGHRRFTTLSGIDGSTRWSLGDTGEFFVSSGINGLLTSRTGTPLRISRIDGATGASLWTSNAFDGYPDQSYALHGVVHGIDGDIYVGGTTRTFDLAINQLRTIGYLVRLDGDDGHTIWGTRLKSNTVWPIRRFNPRFMRDGQIYVSQSLGAFQGSAMTAFTAESGEPLGGSYLFSSSVAQPHVSQQSSQSLTGITADLDTVVSGEQYDAGAPGSLVVSNLGGPFPGPIAAIRASLSGDSVSTGGAVRHSLELRVHNDGGAVVDDVIVMLAIPAGAIFGTTSCEASGSPCDVTTTATSIEGRYAIPPGASIRISGVVTRPGGSNGAQPDRFTAYAFAPHPVTEENLEDNETALTFVDQIFGNSFEN